MKIEIIAVGDKMPQWIDKGLDDYLKRFPKQFPLTIKTVSLLKRTKTSHFETVKVQESHSLRNQLNPRAHVIAMDAKGTSFTSVALAKRLAKLQENHSHLQCVIGGPDGLSQELIDTAHESWSLSPLTLTHPMARLLLTESLYRSWCINHNHPYHK